jgi:hypothetical protein
MPKTDIPYAVYAIILNSEITVHDPNIIYTFILHTYSIMFSILYQYILQVSGYEKFFIHSLWKTTVFFTLLMQSHCIHNNCNNL